MKKLRFDYHMRIAYTEEVKECHFTIKCVPPDTERQRLEEIDIQILPARRWEEGEDSFGNRLLYGRVDEEHTNFSFRVMGTVTAGLADYESWDRGGMLGVYRYPHGLTKPGRELLSYGESVEMREGASSYERSLALMHRIHQDFAYEKNVTNVATTAEEAWRGKRGVCQDYAHVMIALCRMAGIPARYITGMLIGEGYSHAWVEIYSEGKWYGLDPTNDVVVGDSHIKIGTGRDASDCLINRGLLRGNGAQTQTVRVKVEETD